MLHKPEKKIFKITQLLCDKCQKNYTLIVMCKVNKRRKYCPDCSYEIMKKKARERKQRQRALRI